MQLSFGKSKSIVGLDIGSASVKVVECESRSKGVSLQHVGVAPLPPEAIVQGALDVGLHPGLLPGHRRARDEAACREVGEVWGAEVPRGPGWTTKEIFSRAARGDVEVMYVAGQDPVGAWPQSYEGQKAVEAGILAATVEIPSNTGPGLELLAAWRQDGRPLPARVLLSPSSFPPELQLRERRSAADRASASSPTA